MEGWTPSGEVALRFSASDRQVIADVGDYIYPTDVRFDARSELLYVRANGERAAGVRQETWLVEYDVNERKETTRVRVDSAALPPECR